MLGCMWCGLLRRSCIILGDLLDFLESNQLMYHWFEAEEARDSAMNYLPQRR